MAVGKIILNIKLIDDADAKGKINEIQKTVRRRIRRTRPGAKALAKRYFEGTNQHL